MTLDLFSRRHEYLVPDEDVTLAELEVLKVVLLQEGDAHGLEARVKP
jgi:hypothetical protein